MSDHEEGSSGLFDSLKRLLDAGLATMQNRLELVSVELQEEKQRLFHALILSAAVVACGMMVLTLATLTIVIALWDNSRLAALISLTVFYLLAAAWAYRSLRAQLKGLLPFSDTINEIKKDRECLKTRS